jgi:hypothetical protein
MRRDPHWPPKPGELWQARVSWAEKTGIKKGDLVLIVADRGDRDIDPQPHRDLVVSTYHGMRDILADDGHIEFVREGGDRV